jgi:hypothetical protein
VMTDSAFVHWSKLFCKQHGNLRHLSTKTRNSYDEVQIAAYK